MYQKAASSPSNGTFTAAASARAAARGGVAGVGVAEVGWPGWRRKIAGLAWSAKLIIDHMFRHAVFAWLAVAGLVAAAPVRAAADAAAGYALPGKRS